MESTDGAGRTFRGLKFTGLIVVTGGISVLCGALTSHTDLTISILFLSVCLLRVYSLVRGPIWIWMHGPEFRNAIVDLDDDTRARLNDRKTETESLLEIYRRKNVRGDFFPFGVRAVVADAWRKKYREGSRTLRVVTQVIYLSWKYYWFAIIFAAIQIAITYTLGDHLYQPARLMFLLGGYIVVAGSLSIAAEAALSYITFGSWSLGYHRFDIQPERGVTEFSVFVGGLLAAFTSTVAMQAYVSIAYRGYSEITARSGVLGGLGRSIYYTFTAATGNGDAGPHNTAAFILTGLIYLIAAGFLLIVISLVLDSVSADFPQKFAGRRSGGGESDTSDSSAPSA